jgi:hypothetical protein
VSELVPQGFKSWTEYYERKNSPRRIFLENLIITAGILGLVLAYCVVGALEYN